MLYDNGQLASVYAAAYRDTGREEYRYVVEGICDFVVRELKAPGGGFYSALDADSDGEEGKFYRWTDDEVAALNDGVPGFALATKVYRLSEKPNFEAHYHVPDPGKTLTAIATQQNQSFADLNRQLGPLRTAMLDAREQHARPITDVKILTAWNGLMIAGLADAGRLLDRPDYTAAAAEAAEFVLAQLRRPDGRLLRSYAADQAKLNAYVDDYAFLASGLIALHRASEDPKWMNLAAEITDQQVERFWDDQHGGFFFTSKDHPALIVRVKDPADGAVPSGTAVSLENLHYLAKSTGRGDYETKFQQTLQSIAPLMQRVPSATARSAAMLAEWLDQQTP
jgi:uncharacterized protein YyaL (SSP411 family)